VYKFNASLMAITDGDVVEQLVHPDVFRKIRLSNVTVEGDRLRYQDEAARVTEATAAMTDDNGVVTREFTFPAGRMTIQRDGLELLVEVFYRCPNTRGRDGERKILRCALRDRQLDGTEATSPLCHFPNSHPATNRLPHPEFKAAELSIYCFDPERYLPEGEMRDFIVDFDDAVYKNFDPDKFFRLWTRAFEASNMAPWQPAPSLKGVAQHFVENAGRLLARHGYHRMDAVCGFYNVAEFFIDRMGFTFTYGEHQAAFAALQAALKQLESRAGRHLNPREAAWVVALQNIPAEFIPERLRLGVRWFNSPTDTSYVCRLHKELNPFPTDPRVASLTLPALFAPPCPAEPTPDTAGGSTVTAAQPASNPAPAK